MNEYSIAPIRGPKMKPAGGAAASSAAAEPCSSRETERLPSALAAGTASAAPHPTAKKLSASDQNGKKRSAET